MSGEGSYMSQLSKIEPLRESVSFRPSAATMTGRQLHGHWSCFCRGPASNVNKEPQNLITVTVQGLETNALVDSGATLSLVSRTFYDRLRKQRNAKSLKISSYNRRFITADSKPMHVSTALETDIRIAGLNIPVSLIVIGSLCHPIILGMNFFNETKADNQLTNKIFSLYNGMLIVPLIRSTQTQCILCVTYLYHQMRKQFLQ
jgi:hypothetical protein